MTTNETLGRLLWELLNNHMNDDGSRCFEHRDYANAPDDFKKAYDSTAALFAARLGLPELEKALRNAVDAMCQATWGANGQNCGDLNYAIDKARTALKKAEATNAQ